MKVFKTKTFERWAGKAGVTDGALLNAVAHELLGFSDDDLATALARKSLLEIDHEQND